MDSTLRQDNSLIYIHMLDTYFGRIVTNLSIPCTFHLVCTTLLKRKRIKWRIMVLQNLPGVIGSRAAHVALFVMDTHFPSSRILAKFFLQ